VIDPWNGELDAVVPVDGSTFESVTGSSKYSVQSAPLVAVMACAACGTWIVLTTLLVLESIWAIVPSLSFGTQMLVSLAPMSPSSHAAWGAGARRR